MSRRGTALVELQAEEAAEPKPQKSGTLLTFRDLGSGFKD